MNLLIIGLKILLVISWGLMIRSVLELYRSDTGVKMVFDWVSWLNISGTVGLSLVSLFAAIDSTAYQFTVGLIIVTIAAVWFLKQRLLIAGKRKALVGSRIIELSQIRNVYAKFMTLYIETKNETIKMYGPITDRTVTMKLYNAGKGKRV